MRRFALFVVCFTAVVVLGVALPHSRLNAHAAAVPPQSASWHTGDCQSVDSGSEERVCQMRRTSFALPAGSIAVHAMNGGIDVTGENRSDVALEARVTAWAPTEAEANHLLGQIMIDTTNGDVHDSGPRPSFFGHSGYSIDYHLHVPEHIAADLHTTNGGIELTRLTGNLRFETTNGGVNLDQLSGDVEGHTVNGGLNISLAGDRWQGQGLHAGTTNGGVDMRIPDHYSAHLETATVNGGISVDFPVTIQGEIKNHLNTDLGSGGPTIHVQTVNGGISISHNGTPSAD